jgi:lipopolysaccharide/colanic/teichoic acid biosynthesis glycosyltransferase
MKLDQIEAGALAEPIFPEFALRPVPMTFWTFRYRSFKRIVDIVFVMAVMPFIALLVVALLVVNPLFNPGPVFYRQARMGLGGTPFTMWKFRTMLCSATNVRAHDAPLELDRITPLGRFLRISRIDEFPNIFNILFGDMTLIGPRPDAWEHAIKYIDVIPYYRDRFRVMPGITGLAQVRAGYADSHRAVKRKARFDRFYVRKSRIKLDLLILRDTVRVMLTGFGAR